MRVARVLIFLCAAVAIATGATVFAQIHDLSRIPTTSPVPADFVGIWDWATPRQSCGTTRDSYGQPVTFEGRADGRVVCQWPIDRLEKLLNGRGRAWRQFTLNGADDAISPRWTCVAAGLGTVLTEGYLRGFYKRADALVMHFEQSNWFREVWTDGRKHPPATEAYYHGHAIGWMDGKTFVVETTNLTWDPDGYDDHSHIARSHMSKFTERYTLKDKDTMELAITVEDPLFLKEPYTFVGTLKRSTGQMLATWDCDPEVAVSELYQTVNNPYPDDTTPAKYKGK
jgi:hypothetical protein